MSAVLIDCILYLYQHLFNQEQMTKTSKWKPDEENYLKFLKEDQNITCWKTIADQINERFPQSPKKFNQCRERYKNYIKYGAQNNSLLNWSQEEEEIIVSKYHELGAKWKSIQESLINRSENNIKNKFYLGLRKFIRSFNFLSPTYKLKFETIKRMLKATHPSPKNKQFCLEKYSNLRVQILKNSQKQNQPLDKDTVSNIKEMLKQFNSEMRTLFLGKRKDKNNLHPLACIKEPRKPKKGKKNKIGKQEIHLNEKTQVKHQERPQVKTEGNLEQTVRVDNKQIKSLKKEEQANYQERNFMDIPLLPHEDLFLNFYGTCYPYPMPYNWFLPPRF